MIIKLNDKILTINDAPQECDAFEYISHISYIILIKDGMYVSKTSKNDTLLRKV